MFKNTIKQFLSLAILVILAGISIPDSATLKLLIFNMAGVGIVLLLALSLLGRSREWGMIPGLDIEDLFKTASKSTYGAANLFLGISLLLSAILFVVFK